MFNRKKLDRERLEAYLVYLLLRFRPLIAICGLILLALSTAALLQSFFLGITLLLPAAYFVALSSSFELVVLTARCGAWLATMRQSE